MARKYEYVSGRHAWNLEKCEEEVLIAGYDEIRRFIPPEQRWNIDFEYHFFDQGSGITVEFLDSINSVRRRRGLDIIEIRETNVYDYARSHDRSARSKNRRQVREELENATQDERQRRIQLAKAETERLPPALLTYDQYKARLQQHKAESLLNFAEVRKRLLVQEAATAAKSTRAKLAPEQATRMLTLASPNLWDEIIPRLSPEDALAVAEQIDNTELRDALVKHSLG
jgi:hypothetical protein